MSLTDAEKSRIRYFLGFPDVSVDSLGFGAMVVDYQLSPQLDLAMDTVSGEAIIRIRRLLASMEAVEEQLDSSINRMKASKLGDITLNAQEDEKLEKRMMEWGYRLADLLGVTPNPESRRYGRDSINFQVSI